MSKLIRTSICTCRDYYYRVYYASVECHFSQTNLFPAVKLKIRKYKSKENLREIQSFGRASILVIITGDC